MVDSKAKDKESYLNYVCPHCFCTLDKCKCDCNLPYYLIWVDKGIQEHVKVLNQKGYRTNDSCESHSKYMNMYISFVCDYGFGDTLPLPNGFKRMKKNGAVSVLYNNKITDEEFEMQKKEHLNNLLEWCNSLPNVNS